MLWSNGTFSNNDAPVRRIACFLFCQGVLAFFSTGRGLLLKMGFWREGSRRCHLRCGADVCCLCVVTREERVRTPCGPKKKPSAGRLTDNTDAQRNLVQPHAHSTRPQHCCLHTAVPGLPSRGATRNRCENTGSGNGRLSEGAAHTGSQGYIAHRTHTPPGSRCCQCKHRHTYCSRRIIHHRHTHGSLTPSCERSVKPDDDVFAPTRTRPLLDGRRHRHSCRGRRAPTLRERIFCSIPRGGSSFLLRGFSSDFFSLSLPDVSRESYAVSTHTRTHVDTPDAGASANHTRAS